MTWSACAGKPSVNAVIPDTRELRPAAQCDWQQEGDVLVPSNCTWDEGRATIDLGYIREIVEMLSACTKAKI